MTRDDEELKFLDLFVGRKLRERRLKLNLTLVQVAERLNVSHQQIQKYEQAQTRISAPALYQIAMLYGTHPQYFFEGYEFYSRKIAGEEDANHTELNILLVEDDPKDEFTICSTIREIKPNTRIFSVHDGIQAIEILRNRTTCGDFQRPDLVLLDIDIPKKDGISVLKDIKRDPEIHDIPVVMLVNAVNPETLKRVYGLQAAGYINKGDKQEVFKKNIESLINYWSDSVILPYHRVNALEYA